VLYFRAWSNGVAYRGTRRIDRTTSVDLMHWTPPIEMHFTRPTEEEYYTNQTQPYFRAPHILLMLANRFVPGVRVVSEAEFAEFDVWPRARTSGVSDGVLLVSREGTSYEPPFADAFLRPGLDRADWTPRKNHAALRLI
jgi:hypothetical protein